jgi:queuine tRNA-ribosyltransferase
MKFLKIRGKDYNLPIFFPDATRGYIKGISSKDLRKTKISGVVVNAYHILHENLLVRISKKGIHDYMGFNGIIISDSGGFQVMSLIHKNPELGRIYDDKIVFRLDDKKIILTPENCISTQLKIGSDIVMCLDDCTYANASLKEQKGSVKRTVKWARRCKAEFEKLTKNVKKDKKPLLFAIIQGGNNRELRKYCAEELINIGFDGYAFGGFPMHNGKIMINILKYVSKLIPDDKPKYAMGLGKPGDIIECVKLGYNMFDCVIPTRDARHKRLFIFTKKPNKKNISKSFKEINIRAKFCKAKKISKYCDCETCKNYTRKKLLTLFKANRKKANRLATIHNLRFYSIIMGTIGKNRNL